MEFPFLARGLAYLDNANTSQKPREVLDAMRAYDEAAANIHRGIYKLSVQATEKYEAARKHVAALIDAPPEHVVFTSGTTEALNGVAHSWGLFNLSEGDEILLTPLEHHANIVPWQHVAAVTKARVLFCGLDGHNIDVEDLKRRITERTKVLAITHASNVLGSITPLAELIAYAREHGVIVVVDGAQAVPHLPVSMRALRPDFYAFSGHKMLGPTGIGALYLDAKHLAMEPYRYGGDMIDDVTEDGATYAAGEPRRFEGGTPNVSGAIGLGEAARLLKEHGMERVLEHGRELLGYARTRLTEAGCTVLDGDGIGVLLFTVPGVHPHDVAQVLDEHGVCVRSGLHCAHPLMRRLGLDAANRASFQLYNTKEDVDRLLEGVAKVREVFS